MNWNHNRRSVLRYVGAKLRIAPRIAETLKATGADVCVDVFGGSGAVIMNAGFEKRVYNDADEEMVNFFRVMAHPALRRQLHRSLKHLPMSRKLFGEAMTRRRDGTGDPVERAVATFYVSRYAFGGKIKNGGFAASVGDVGGIKELKATRRVISQLREVGAWWQDTVIENLHFAECITAYGKRSNTVLYCDPPYDGTERHYNHPFTQSDHIFLAEQLAQVKAAVVVSYYETPLVRELYPEAGGWVYARVETVKNSMGRQGVNKVVATELLICKSDRHEPK